MKYALTIVDTTTGEGRTYFDAYDWKREDDFIYQYVEGNYACDCNRSLFFARATGAPEPTLDETQCGFGRYRIDAAVREDGSTLLLDDGP